ncbi:MAG: DNA internalization-related competence protein ComEC/Rec2 [Clostridiales bacterium]|nr:DNA internalization-related competence protein ComEC/Rec2 [Clostridiales bacterium]
MAQYLVPASCLVFCCVVFAALALIGLFFNGCTRLRILLICLGLSAGFIWSFTYATVFYKPAEKLNGKTETVFAVVCGEPVSTDYGSKALVSVRIDGAFPVKTQIYIFGGVPYMTPGNTVRFTAAFRIADTMYGEQTDTFVSRGIYLLASVKGELEVTDASEPAAYFPIRLSSALARMIDTIFPENTAVLIRALLLGDTASISKDPALSSSLQTTGTSHIVAVSGMNIAFLMGFLGLFIKKKRVLTAVGIPVIVLFMAVVGFMPPVVRAGIMQIFLLIAPVFKRESDPVTSLSASLVLILLFNPFAAVSAGLHLSFAATLGILLFSEKIFTALDEPLRERRIYHYTLLRKPLRLIIGSFSTTIGALALTVPLTALHFGAVSLITPLTNLIILWAVTLAFCGGIVAVVCGFIYAPAGAVLAFAVGLPVDFILKTIEAFSQVPFASVYTENPAVVIWLVYIYLLLVALVIWHIGRRQLLYPVCLSVVSLCFILVMTSLFSCSHHLSLTALDVGQGQALVVTSGKCTAVVDCGSSSGKDSADIAVKYLQSRGRTGINLLILTHYHSDHTNGVIELLEQVNVSAIALPAPDQSDGTLPEEIFGLAREKGISVIQVTENMTVSFNNAVLTLYAPPEGVGENERGLSVLCSENGFDALITGDMSAEGERRLIAAEQLPDIELLVTGHHGSGNSTSPELLLTVKPETALVSVGYNKYGHPSRETLERLALDGIMVYRTDQAGSITINGW